MIYNTVQLLRFIKQKRAWVISCMRFYNEVILVTGFSNKCYSLLLLLCQCLSWHVTKVINVPSWITAISVYCLLNLDKMCIIFCDKLLLCYCEVCMLQTMSIHSFVIASCNLVGPHPIASIRYVSQLTPRYTQVTQRYHSADRFCSVMLII